MPDHSEPCYSHEIFVPREIIFEICTVAEHLKYWWPDAENAVTQSTAPSVVVYQLKQDTGDTPSSYEITLELHDLGGSVRIDVHQSTLSGKKNIEQVKNQWHQRLAAMENYLSSI